MAGFIMSEETNALLALKDAWTGVVDASDRVKDLAASVQALPETTPIEGVDLETWHRVVLAQSNAVMALRGLIEQLRETGERQIGAAND
jgi:hypothetical protein